MSFGDKLKTARKNKLLSQRTLAEKLHVTDGTISNYEQNVAFPRYDKIIQLCDILDVDPNYFFWDDLSESLKNKALKEKSSQNTLYDALDEIDKAEIRGEMKHMLKADKYSQSDSSAAFYNTKRKSDVEAVFHTNSTDDDSAALALQATTIKN